MGHITKRQADVISEGIKQREYAIHNTYNSRGLLESETEMPSGKKTSYTYNSMGNLEVKIKPDGILLYHTYDALGRLKTLSSSDKTIHYVYTYDFHNNIIQVEDLVHDFTQHREFDLLDRLIKEEIYPGIIINYNYDILDRLVKLILPDQSYVIYSYQSHYLSKIERYNKSNQLLYSIECPEYDLRGNLLKSISPAGNIKYAYDLLSRTISIDSPVWSSSLNEFDAAGNLLSMTQKDQQGISQKNFSYDRFNHLSKESSFLNHQYTYDSLGNCLTKDNQPQTINSLNQMTHHDNSSFTYDKNGNLTKHDTIIYTYDALNRLIRINDETELLYDAFGRCLQIKEISKIRHLLYQGNQEIGSLVNQTLDEFRLIHPNSQEITFAIEIQENSYFPIQDSFHNTCVLQNSDGSIAQLTKYSAFGEKQTEGKISIPWSYANRREIENLILFTHRFYNPVIMRWQTPDPIGFEDGLNLYTYVHNNPFRYNDLDGQFAFVIPIVIGAFGAGGITISATTAGTIVGAAIGTAVGFCSYKVVRWADSKLNNTKNDSNELNEEKDTKNEKPPYCGEKLGNDPSKSPGKGFEWKGKGSPESGKGSWVKNWKQPNEEKLHPDINHPPPKAPHWDYEGPDYPKGVELYIDGTWKPKDF